MSIIKDIKELKKQIAILNEKMLNKEIIFKAQKYDEMVSNLNKIKFGLKIKKQFNQETGDVFLKIDYELPSIELHFDENGNVIKNDLFYSINVLNLLDDNNLNILQQEIEKLKKVK